MKLADLQVIHLSEFACDFQTQSYLFWSGFNASKIYCKYRVTPYAKSNPFRFVGVFLQNPSRNNRAQTQQELNSELWRRGAMKDPRAEHQQS